MSNPNPIFKETSMEITKANFTKFIFQKWYQALIENIYFFVQELYVQSVFGDVIGLLLDFLAHKSSQNGEK